MRRYALFLSSLMLSAIFVMTIEAADTTVSTTTTWPSDDYTMQGNITITSGTTLTIEDFSTVDAKTYSIVVEGVLRASNTTFFSSQPPLTGGSQGQGMWPGIHVAPGGSVFLNDVQISNAESALYVEGTAQLEDLHLNHSYIGIRIDGGVVTATSVDVDYMDFDGVRIESSGMLSLDQGTFSDVSIGIQSDGQTSISNLAVHRAGIAMKGVSGVLAIDQSGVYNSTIGYVSQYGVQMRINDSVSFDTVLSIDAGDSDDLQIHRGAFEGQRFLFASGAESIVVDDVSFSGSTTEQRYAMDVRCTSACDFSELSMTNVSKGIQLTGNGPFQFDSLDIHNAVRGIDIVGSSTLTLSQSSIEATESTLDSQGASTMVEDSSFNLTSNSKAVSLIQGSHDWDGATIKKPYSSQDHSSNGMYIWYSIMSATSLDFSGWSTGLVVDSTTMDSQYLTITQGVDVGIVAENSRLSIQDLTTQSSDTGIEFAGASPLQIVNWTAELHQTPLLLEHGALANIRSFKPINTAPNSADALGDGTLYFGSPLNPTISTTASYQLIETPVTFTDLVSSPIEANVVVHGFKVTSNSNGAANLPLVSSGSVADVTYLGAGVRITLYGGQNGQSVQVPVIPQGSWTISSGQSVVLGPRPDGQAHILGGDLTIQTNAQLTLVGTEVLVPSGSSVQIEGSGTLYGTHAVLTTDLLSLGASSFVSGSIGPFDIVGDVTWSCLSKRQTESLFIVGHLTLQPNCEVDLLNGYVDGEITAWTGAKMTLKSSLHVTVLDKGTPISGAVISIDGATSQTNEFGQVTAFSNARVVNEMSETWGGRKVITLQYGSFNDFISWETNASLDHTFMVSTVPTGVLNDWLVLEKRWSPYVLTDSLTIGMSGILTINDGVELRIASGASILVNGQLDAGQAMLSSTGGGVPWGGLQTGTAAGSLIELSGTSVVETSPAMTIGGGSGTMIANDATFARSGAEPLMVVTSGSSAHVEITNSSFSNAGLACLMAYPSNALIRMTDITMNDCGDVGLSIQQTEIDISKIHFSGTMTRGIQLLASEGTLTYIESDDFSGSSPFIDAYGLDETMHISNVEATSTNSPVIRLDESVGFEIHDLILTGSPAIELIESAGLLSSIQATGFGLGTGIDVEHGKYSSAVRLIDTSITNYAIGISFHEDEQGNSAPALLRDVAVSATTAIATDRYNLRIEDATLEGDVQAYGCHLSILDSEIESTSLSEGAEVEVFNTFMVEAQLDGIPIPAQVTWSIDGVTDDGLKAYGVGLSIEMLTQKYTETNHQIVTAIEIVAKADGYPSEEVTVNPQELDENKIILSLTPNQAPSVSFVSPYPGQRMMETESFMGEITVSDDLDDAEALTIRWSIQDSQGTEVYDQESSTTNQITGLTAGFYILVVDVSDTLGSTTSKSVDFEVTLLDTDRDWLSSCDAATWFDAANGRSCGPDVYDGDDDDDGVSDEKDDFPLDPCAAFDTDGDGQPDTLDCPEGETTLLTEDDDDDGNGIPDILESQDNDQSDDDLNLTLLAAILLIVLVALLLMRARKGDGSAAETLDLSSLQKRDAFDQP